MRLGWLNMGVAMNIFNRPGVAGAVLHTALSVMVCENMFTAPLRPNGWTWCFQS